MRYIHSEERLPILDNGERISFFFMMEEAGRTQYNFAFEGTKFNTQA